MLKPQTVDVGSLPSAPLQPSRSVANPRHFPDANLLAELKQEMAQHKFARSGGKPKPSPSPTPTPSPSSGFNGIGFLASGGYVPPDTQVAAGPTYLFEAVNLTGQIFTKAGQSVASFSLYSFFNVPTSDSLTDPRVLYDASSGHWFAITSIFGPNSAYGWNLAVSATDDPTGRWYVYYYPTSASFPDFPKVGLNSDKVVITGDAFSGNSFLGTEFVVFNKSEVIAGAATTPVFFGPVQGDFAIEPAIHLAPVSSPTTSNPDALYMAAVAYPSANSVEVWTVTGVPDTSQTVSISNPPVVSMRISPLTSPPNAAQPGTSKTLDTNDNALLDAVFRDGSPGELWVTANDGCTPSGDTATRSCLRLIEISISSGTMLIAQDFDYSAANEYLFYPAIRTDSKGDLAVVFNSSSTSQYPSVYRSVQLTSDPRDSLENPVQLRASSSAYTQSARWGDYSGAGLDSSNDTVWVAGEYATSCGFFFRSCWGTWIANVQP